MTAKQTVAPALQPFVDSRTLAGAVMLVAGPEEILTLEAVGFSDVSAQKPMPTDALFWIASTTKPLTATAVMMLADEGKLNLDDPVEKYLPEYQGQWLAVLKDNEHVLLQKPKRPFTVKEMLNHTSGLCNPRFYQKFDTYSLRESVIGYALTPLNFEPGTRYEYTNAGPNTLGRLIEVISGQDYAEFLDQRLLQPLGMRDTTLWPAKSQLQRLAKVYKPNADKSGLEELPIEYFTYPLENHTRTPFPGGGYFSTAADLAVFAQMILNGGVQGGRRYLSSAAVQQMTSRQTGQLEQNYGLGWQTDAPPGPCFGHGGAYNNHLWIDPVKKLITIWMVQHSGYGGQDGGKVLPAFLEAASSAFA